MTNIETGSAALRAVALLEAVANANRPLALTDVVETLRLPKPTVYRMMVLLEQSGLLLREPDGKRYSVGPRLSAFAMSVIMNSVLRAPRHAILERLVQEIGETCNVTMLEDGEVLYLDRVETAWPLRMHLAPGSRVPLHCTASGKLLLSQLPEKQQSRIIQGLRLERYTENTIVDKKAFKLELERIREQQVGTDSEEFLSGMICVAVPILDPGDEVCASVAVHAPVARMSLERGLSYVPSLQRAAKELSTLFFDGQYSAITKQRSARSASTDPRRYQTRRPKRVSAKAA